VMVASRPEVSFLARWQHHSKKSWIANIPRIIQIYTEDLGGYSKVLLIRLGYQY
jgi:hypothetical protein